MKQPISFRSKCPSPACGFKARGRTARGTAQLLAEHVQRCKVLNRDLRAAKRAELEQLQGDLFAAAADGANAHG